MLRRLKTELLNKKGLSLVETLVALTIIMLVVFFVTPLFVTNFDTIKRSGNKAQQVYKNNGIMQKILGNFQTGDDTANAGYDIDVASASITLSGDNASYTVQAQGDLLVSNPENIAAGYATVMADSPDSTFQVFPKSLTDDFKEAYLTVAAIGFSFVDEPGSSIYQLYCNKNGTNVLLKYGDDYIMRRVETDDPTVKNRVMQIVLYGGTEVNFSNSPLTLKYKGYTKTIQIDAPSMIMVGEKSADGYRYYVTRGETEKDSDGNDRLIVLERYMGDGVPLTSAMNDIAWVSAEDADEYAVGADGEKYGYYVMCGDNGQIRRFWQNPSTGNYYWGGDYTYYTDINLNRVEGNSYVNADKKFSTSVSYKFLARRGTVGNEGTDGFQLVHGTESAWNKNPRSDNAMVSTANMWTVTALDGSAASQNAYFYASDGRVIYYYLDEGVSQGAQNGLMINSLGDGSFDTVKSLIFGKSSAGGKKIRGQGEYDKWNWQDLNWLKVDQNSYYDIQGISKSSVNSASYPITLTSVGAIVLQGSSNIGNDQAYAGSTSYANYDVSDGGAVVQGSVANYPTSTYTLYCGYIPSAYDVWSRKSANNATVEFAKDGGLFGGGKTFANAIVANETFDNRTEYSIQSNMQRRTDKIYGSAIEKNSLWRGTFGITPYFSNSADVNAKLGAAQLIYNGYAKSLNRYWYDYLYFWPYTNVNYAVTGKFFDAHTDTSIISDDFIYPINAAFNESTVYSTRGDDNQGVRQEYLTGGKVIDITCSYYSHPFALHVASNPSIDSKAYMLSNNKTNTKEWSYYYANRRETVTILKIASTKIPIAGEKDINVSLAVGYAQGGSITFSQISSTYAGYVNNIMPIGIVYLRAGTANIGKQEAYGNATGEYQAIDKTGYQLAEESNYFHQFYYLNSKLDENTKNAAGPGRDAGGDEYTLGGIVSDQAHIGDMYGAYYWENNRHIVHRSADGGEPLGNTHSQNVDGNGSYNYVRCHPMVDTKVTCVAWGTTWDNNPEAMWGTDNGTVLSWWVQLNASDLTTKSSKYNDKSVEAEIQSYQWIENVDNNYFSVTGKTIGSATNYKETVGAHLGSKNNYKAQTFARYNSGPINEAFSYFCDKSTQANGYWKNGYGFISILSSINDIAYANDYWIAVGNQSGKDPAEYCGNSSLPNVTGTYYGGSNDVKAYTGNGQGGSWVNVRYWYDAKGTGTQSEDNATYLWKAVKISNNPNYNIVQIKCLNGIWFATGYEDSNRDGEWDEGERAVVCWARDPLAPCDGYDQYGKNAAGRWSENTQFYRTTGKGEYQAMSSADVGGINSVACRDDV
ncbi:MAG: hypothetical protein J1F37_03330 [Oscillospiraceae bacterium]|nr:hypothetical protein [Oscillospiraceae bacterium]